MITITKLSIDFSDQWCKQPPPDHQNSLRELTGSADLPPPPQPRPAQVIHDEYSIMIKHLSYNIDGFTHDLKKNHILTKEFIQFF